MADQNPGEFGNRNDTEKQAKKGGEASTGSFGEKDSADPSQAGQEGAKAQSTADKAKGGENSQGGN